MRNQKNIFILGCERSGSTWLSNIFDAHSKVEYFMEPFADYIDIFPGFPDRNFYYPPIPNEEVEQFVLEKMTLLPKYKYYLFYAPSKKLYLQKIDFFLYGAARKLSTTLKQPLNINLLRFSVLNLNRIQGAIEPIKKSNLTHKLYKELRLNFKINLLARCYSDATYIVTIRNPYAQIQSIIELFGRGSLGELKKYLRTFGLQNYNNPRFERFRPILAQYHQFELSVKLLLWWIINYETLIEDLRANSLDHMIVYHEELSDDPAKRVSYLMDRCSLKLSDEVSRYILESSQKSGSKNPVDTHRMSSSYYKERIAALDPKFIDQLKSYFEKYSTLTELRERYL